MLNSLFGTSGIRGPAKKLFTPQFCFDIGASFAIFLDRYKQTGPVAIGIDNRQSSPHIQEFLASGLISQGRFVHLLGMLPVPATHYSIISTSAVASIMVTGSHIDFSSNGVKFFAFKEEILKEHEREITSIYNSIKNKTPLKKLNANTQNDTLAKENYQELLLSVADQPLPRNKIVVDTGNGAQTEVIKTVLHKLNQDVIFINDNTQEKLISRDTESDGSFTELQNQVKSHKALFGVGFDSDGDRVIFIDKNGEFIQGDYTGTILAKFFASDTVVTPINTSNVINSINRHVIRTKVGSPFVVSAMKQYGASFGFESNGGGIHADILMSRDGGVSLIRLLNILYWKKTTLDQLLNSLPKLYNYKQKFDSPKEKNQIILERAKVFLKAERIDQTDGVKLILDKYSWVLFRPSSNAPEFRIFTESNHRTKAKQLLQDALNFAKKLSISSNA